MRDSSEPGQWPVEDIDQGFEPEGWTGAQQHISVSGNHTASQQGCPGGATGRGQALGRPTFISICDEGPITYCADGRHHSCSRLLG